MEKKTFKTTINAPAEKVWNVLWENKSYDQWATAFGPNQPVHSDWKQGSRIQFLSAGGDGMLSEVAENKSPEKMTFKHLGIVNKGKEDTNSSEAKKWIGAKESYTLKPFGEKTELIVETDLTEDFVDYFDEKWPEALDRIKEMAENK